MAVACALFASCGSEAPESALLKSAEKNFQAGSYAAAQVDLKQLLAANPQSAQARLLPWKPCWPAVKSASR